MKDWDDVRYFLAVARAGSVTAAAAKLGVNHSTVSRRIGAFETRLGVRLFERMPSGYALTPPGEEMLGDAQGVERDIATMSRKIASRDARMTGTLRITAPESILFVVIMPNIAKFCKIYPGIEIYITATPQILSLNNREADLAIRITNRPPEGLIGRKLTGQRAAKYASRSYLEQRGLMSGAERSPGEIPTGNHTWIGLVAGKARPDWVNEHFPDARCAARLDSIFNLFEAAKAGLGIAELPCRIASADPCLVRLPSFETEKYDDVWILYHRDMRHMTRLRAFSDFLTKVFVAEKHLFMGN